MPRLLVNNPTTTFRLVRKIAATTELSAAERFSSCPDAATVMIAHPANGLIMPPPPPPPARPPPLRRPGGHETPAARQHAASTAFQTARLAHWDEVADRLAA